MRGDLRTAAKRRKEPDATKIAHRVEKFRGRAEAHHAVEGVQRLNAGFFELQRMRTQPVVKARAAKRVKVRGK